MKCCVGCIESILPWQRYEMENIPMTDSDPIIVTFHYRCHRSYIMGLATAKNNPRAREILRDYIQTTN